MTQLAFHPLADIFPLLEGEEFDALVADIQASSLCEAVWLYQGQILDGRNRYRACQRLGRDCATRDYLGNDPLAFVLSMNLQRRHLDESQRAMIAVRLATMRQGERTDLVEISTKLSQEQAAELVHVSRETVVAAKKVLQDGAPELAQAMEAGTLTVSAAAPLTVLPREDQLTALQEARHEATGKKTTAKQTRAVVRRRQEATTVTPERDGHMKAAEVARAALPKRLSQLFDLLEALATFPDIEQLLLDIPPDCYDRVDQYLDTAFATLNRLRTFRKEPRHDATEVLVQPRAPQRVRQPIKGKTRRRTTRAQKHAAPKAKTRQPVQTTHAATATAQSQPDLLLVALRTVQQPLMIEDLRQLPGVDGSGVKRNVNRLVGQRKIQETPAGYVLVPA
jgi:ParB-like chromosome segregation protein Spo0J